MTASDRQLSQKNNTPSNTEAEEYTSASLVSQDEEQTEIDSIKEKIKHLESLLESAQKSRLKLVKQKRKEKKLAATKEKKCCKKLRKQLKKAIQQNILIHQELIMNRVHEIEDWQQKLEEALTE